jgi:hypothetical protein
LIINFPLSGVIFVAWISLKTRFWPGELHALKSGHIMVVAAATDNSATYGTFVVSIAEQEKYI